MYENNILLGYRLQYSEKKENTKKKKEEKKKNPEQTLIIIKKDLPFKWRCFYLMNVILY